MSTGTGSTGTGSTDTGSAEAAQAERPGEPAVLHDSVRFSDRFSAFVVDLLILAGAQILATFVLARLLQAAGMRTVSGCTDDELVLCEGPSTIAWVIVGIAFVAVTLGYHAFFEGRYGATPGKRMAGLTVRNAAGSYAPIGLARGVIRSLVRQSFWWMLLLVFATALAAEKSADESTILTLWFVGGLGLGLVSLASAAFWPHGRSLHDVIASSRVTYEDITHDRTGPAADAASLPGGGLVDNNSDIEHADTEDGDGEDAYAENIRDEEE